jgi:hypothetical protein
MKDTILRFVNLAGGITSQKLLLDMMAEYGPSTLDVDEFNKVIDGLVEKGKIVRVQYVIPPNGHKMRSGALYLPERSVVIVNAQNDRTHFRSQR